MCVYTYVCIYLCIIFSLFSFRTLTPNHHVMLAPGIENDLRERGVEWIHYG